MPGAGWDSGQLGSSVFCGYDINAACLLSTDSIHATLIAYCFIAQMTAPLDRKSNFMRSEPGNSDF